VGFFFFPYLKILIVLISARKTALYLAASWKYLLPARKTPLFMASHGRFFLELL